MTKENFKSRLQALKLTQAEFADKIGYSAVAIKKWQDGQIPKWAEFVLKYLELASDAKEAIREKI